MSSTTASLENSMRRPLGARMVVLAMSTGLIALVTWAAFAEIDQVTRAPAQVIAAERTQVIQAAESGVVTKIHVKEGDKVTRGQLLITLQKERAQAAVSDTSSKVAALRITLARLDAELSGTPLRFDASMREYQEFIENQTELYTRRRTALQEEIESLEKILLIAKDELQINETLVKSGDVSRAEVLKLQRAAADISAQIANRRNKYLQDAQADRTKAQEELNTQQEQLNDRSQILEHMEISASADGVVNNIKSTTLGAVLRPGDVVMELFPTGGALIAEAKVPPVDIAFVKEGQLSFIKLDAYDSSIYGSLTGRVSYISPDVLKEEGRQGPISYYRVHILMDPPKVDPRHLQGIVIRPGLTATVEIKADERTVLSYLTKPITKTLGNALGER